MYMCLDCGTYYNKQYLTRYEMDSYNCLAIKCCGKVVNIDEIIAPSIYLLNHKGYMTKFCCSGHSSSAKKTSDNFINFYIMFDDNIIIPEELIPNIYECEYSIDDNNEDVSKEEFIKYNGYKYMTIRYSNIDDIDFESTHIEIISNALLLEQWCELLPEYNDKLNEYVSVGEYKDIRNKISELKLTKLV